MVAVVVAKRGAATGVETAAAVMAVAMGEGTAAQGVVTAAGTAVVAGMATATGMEMAMAMAMAMAERIPASLRTLRIPATCRCPIWIRPSQAATSASGLAA